LLLFIYYININEIIFKIFRIGCGGTKKPQKTGVKKFQEGL